MLKTRHIGSRRVNTCGFCRHSDPDFEERNPPMDRMVCSNQHTATGHVTENGYVRHRMLEIEVRLGVIEFALMPNVA